MAKVTRVLLLCLLLSLLLLFPTSNNTLQIPNRCQKQANRPVAASFASKGASRAEE
jgi:hypothetical protein